MAQQTLSPKKKTIYLNKKLNEGKKICNILILIFNFKKKHTNKKINIAKNNLIVFY